MEKFPRLVEGIEPEDTQEQGSAKKARVKSGLIVNVAGGNADRKERAAAYYGEVFDAPQKTLELMCEKEREKTGEELEMINLANIYTNQIRAKYGLDDLWIPPENVHVVAQKDWERRGEIAYYWQKYQQIVICEAPSKMEFFSRVMHEMIHFKSHNSAQLKELGLEDFDFEEGKRTDGEGSLRQYRVGLMIQSRDFSRAEKPILNNLNEAVTEEITRKMLWPAFKHPAFGDEVAEIKKFLPEESYVDTVSGEDLREKMIHGGKHESKRIIDRLKRSFGMNGPRSIEITGFSYVEARRMLYRLEEKLLEANPGEFKNIDEVSEVFERAAMTGNLLPLARLVDGTFGAGTLRKIGEMDDSVEDQLRYVEFISVKRRK